MKCNIGGIVSLSLQQRKDGVKVFEHSRNRAGGLYHNQCFRVVEAV